VTAGCMRCESCGWCKRVDVRSCMLGGRAPGRARRWASPGRVRSSGAGVRYTRDGVCRVAHTGGTQGPGACGLAR
jgi:hypothetical protein